MTLFFFLRLVGDLSLFYALANAFLCMTSCDVAFRTNAHLTIIVSDISFHTHLTIGRCSKRT